MKLFKEQELERHERRHYWRGVCDALALVLFIFLVSHAITFL